MIDPQIYYNQFVDDFPNKAPEEDEKTPEALGPRISKIHPGEEVQEESLTIEESQLSDVFSRFNKCQTLDKFKSLVDWVESKKPVASKKIYNSIKKFRFSSRSEFDPIFKGTGKISSMALSPNNQVLAVVCGSSKINIINFPDKKTIGCLGINENINEIFCLAMNDLALFSGGWDKKIRKWSLLTFALEEALEGHSGSVLCMALTPDGSSLISSGQDRTIIVWDLMFCKVLKQFEAHSSPVSALEVSPKGDKLISASWDKLIKVWRLSDFQLDFILKGHTDIIRTIALCPSGKFLASSGRDKIIKIWDLTTQYERTCLQDHKDTVMTLKFAAYGDFLISAGLDNKIKIWNLAKKKMKKSINARTEITSLLVTSEGQRFLSGGFDSTVKLWNMEQETEMRMMEKTMDEIEFLIPFPDNARALSCLKDGTLRIWNVLNGSLLETIKVDNGVSALGMSKDETFFATGNKDGYLTLWNPANYQKIRTEKIHLGPIVSIKFHLPSGSVMTAEEENIKISSLELKQKGELTERHSGKIIQMELGLYANMLITIAQGDSTIYLWKSKDLKKAGQLVSHTAEVTSIKALPFSTKLVSGSLDQSIKVWNLQSKSLETSINTELKIIALELTFDSFTIVASHGDASLRLWDAKTGEQIGRTPAFPNIIKKMSLTHDGATLLTIGGKADGLRKIKLHKIKAKVILNHHTKAVNVIALNKDKTILAAGSEDTTISIIEIETMKVKFTLKGHTKSVKNLIFIDMDTLVSAAEDRTLRLWDLKNENSPGIVISDGIGISDIFHQETEENDNNVIASCYDSKLRIISLKDKKVKRQCDCELLITKIVRNNGGDLFYAGDNQGNLSEYSLDVLDLKKIVSSEAGSAITALAISNDDSKLFSSSMISCLISIHRLQDFTLLARMFSHSQEVTSLIVNAKSTKLFSASADNHIMIWDALNFKKIREFDSHTAAVRCLALDGDQDSLYSCSEDKTIRTWNLKDSRKIPFLEGHSYKILQMETSNNNEFLVTGDENNILFVWDLTLNTLKYTLKSSEGCSIRGLGITHDNSRIVSCNDTGIMTVWDSKSGRKIHEFADNDGENVSKMILSNGKPQHAIMAFSDSTIRCLNLAIHVMAKRFVGHQGIISDLVLSKDSKIMVSAANDGKVIVWDFEKQAYIKAIYEETTLLALSQDDTLLFTGNLGKMVVWNFKTFETLKIFEDQEGIISKIKVSPDNQRLFASFISDDEDEDENMKNPVKVWSLKFFEPLNLLGGDNKNSISSCENFAISPDQKKIYLAQKKAIAVYNYTKCDFNSTLSSGSFEKITAETMSPNKQLMIMADSDKHITVYDLRLRQKVTQFTGHKKIISCLIATDDNLLISGSNDMTIKVWNIQENREIMNLHGHMAEINAIALCEEKHVLLSTSAESGIILWNLNTGDEIRRFRTEENLIYSLIVLYFFLVYVFFFK